MRSVNKNPPVLSGISEGIRSFFPSSLSSKRSREPFLQAGLLTYGSGASAPFPALERQWLRASGSPITVAGP